LPVKKNVANLDIHCWEHVGVRLGSKRPFICLQAAPEACARLLAAVDELAAEGHAAQRALKVNHCQNMTDCSTIRLRLAPASNALDEMSLTIERGTAILEFSPTGLKTFRDAVVIWRDGSEDFAVHPSRQATGHKDKNSGEV
jgi:hypothetical protein